MKKIHILYLVFIFMGFSNSALCQERKQQYIRKGNKEYENKKYNEAEILYRKALAKDSTYVKADYNLANSLYKQKQFKEANIHYNKLLENSTLKKDIQSQIYHNLGNSYLQQGLEKSNTNAMQDFQNAVNSYKNSLRINPTDKETKYNLAYAQKYLIQEQEKQQQQKQNKDQNNQEKDKQEQQQENKQEQNQEQKQQQEAQKEMKKSDAERVLDALKNNEKSTLEKIKQKDKAKSQNIEKDW